MALHPDSYDPDLDDDAPDEPDDAPTAEARTRKPTPPGRPRGNDFDDVRVPPVDLLAAPDLTAGLPADASADDFDRPTTRGECIAPGGPHAQRPCPWLSCAHHALHILAEHHPVTRAVTDADNTLRAMPSDDREAAVEARVLAWLGTAPVTCTLDAAELPRTLDECGSVMGVTRERVRQVETIAIRRLLVTPTGQPRRVAAMLRELLGGGADDTGPELHVHRTTPTRAARSAEGDAPATPPPALAGLPHPTALTDVTATAWCPTLRAPVTGTLCGRRHTARMQHAHGAPVPIYKTCSECLWGAEVVERFAIPTAEAEGRVVSPTRFVDHTNTAPRRRLPVLAAHHPETNMKLQHIPPNPNAIFDTDGTTDGASLKGACLTTGCAKSLVRHKGRVRAVYSSVCRDCAGRISATVCDTKCDPADAVAYFVQYGNLKGFTDYLRDHDLPRRDALRVAPSATPVRGASKPAAPAVVPVTVGAPETAPAVVPMPHGAPEAPQPVTRITSDDAGNIALGNATSPPRPTAPYFSAFGAPTPATPPTSPTTPQEAMPTSEFAPATTPSTTPPPASAGTDADPYLALLKAATPFGLRAAAKVLNATADYFDTLPAGTNGGR